MSPFWTLNTKLKTEHYTKSQIIIVWRVPDEGLDRSCATEEIWNMEEEIGTLVNVTERIVDGDQQLEIPFWIRQKQELCKAHVGTFFIVIGLSELSFSNIYRKNIILKNKLIK